MSNFSVEVRAQYPLEDMWREVRNLARGTVGKGEIDSPVSDHFKAKMLVSEHSPIRELRFHVYMHGIPTYVAQQFSRHRIALQNPGEFRYMDEVVNPMDVEHYCKTQRSDRTGETRGAQDAPIDYQFTANAQGFIDMSKKRLCMAASAEARAAWLEVRKGLIEVEPLLGRLLVPSCMYRRDCPEFIPTCQWRRSTMYNGFNLDYSYVWAVASTPDHRKDK